MQYLGVERLVLRFPRRASRPLPRHGADCRIPGRSRRAGAAGAEDDLRDDHRRPSRRATHQLQTNHLRKPTSLRSLPIDWELTMPYAHRPHRFSAQAASIKTSSTENKQLLAEIDRRGIAARRGQPRRADDADRMRCNRSKCGTERPDGCFLIQRQGPGVPVPAQPSGADLYGSRGRQTATLQCLLRDHGSRAGRYCELEARACRTDRGQAPWTVQQINELPEQELIVRHICVEGWDYIGQWSGVNMRHFLERIGADLTAKYVAFKMCRRLYRQHRHGDRAASTNHPRDQIRQGADHRSVRVPAAAADRDQARVQEPKWITAIEVTNTYPGGYWEDQGFNWYSGI